MPLHGIMGLSFPFAIGKGWFVCLFVFSCNNGRKSLLWPQQCQIAYLKESDVTVFH